MLKPIYTEPDNCQDCYKCIRECPVKAIRMEDNLASIVEERCIYCGHCTQICPAGAKKVRDGLTRAQLTLSRHSKVYLSLAPSYVSEFGGIAASVLINVFKHLGFAGVSETALGAEVVSAHTEDFLSTAEKGIYISSACPVVVKYITKYADEYVPNITPITSPMLAHAKILKKLYGDDIKVIFAGPCIGKKLEADAFSDLVDVVITFKDLKRWFDNEGIDLRDAQWRAKEEKFIPYASGLGTVYPLEGGMLQGMKKTGKPACYMAFSDLLTIKDVLKNITPDAYNDSIFLELLACKGGCINGPEKLNNVSLALKRYGIEQQLDMGDPAKEFKYLDLHIAFKEDSQKQKKQYSEIEIKQALEAVGKISPEDELNCSSCGYDSCRDFAVAMLEKRAEESMCASYMRKIAHDKATVFLQKIPAGVVLVNSDLKVMDMNRYCAASLGEEIAGIYDDCPGLSGAALNKICSFESLFKTVLTTGKEINDRHVRDKDKTWIVSIFNIQPYRQVFGLIRNLQDPGIKEDWIIEKTKEVIKNHMLTVQQVAGLLGENAAFTDATLRSVMELYRKDEDKKTL